MDSRLRGNDTPQLLKNEDVFQDKFSFFRIRYEGLRYFNGGHYNYVSPGGSREAAKDFNHQQFATQNHG